MGRPRPDLRSVLVAQDDSPGATRAEQRATLLPLGEGATVHLARVVAPDEPAADQAAKRLEERAAAARDRLQRAGRIDVDVVGTLLEGSTTAEELLRHARTKGAELIILGRHRDEAHGEPSMGSTVFELLRRSDLPLLVVVRAPERGYQRPVLAVDLTDASGQVVQLALSLLPTPAPGLDIVHALRVPFQGALSWAGGGAAAEDARRQTRDEAQARADRFVASLGPVAASATAVVSDSEASVAMLAESARRGADLLVVGTHGRSGLAHALFGSVAEWLVASAPCDVAVTHPTRHTSDLR